MFNKKYFYIICVIFSCGVVCLLVTNVYGTTQFQDGQVSASGADVHIDGQVGVATAAPLSELTIHGGAAENDGALTFDVDGTDWYIGIDDSDADYLKIGTGSTVGSNVRLSINAANGNVGIAGNPNYLLDVRENAATYSTNIFNDGNNANRNGLLIQCGQTAGSGTLVGFFDGNGTSIGSITFAGGTVSYNAFTANHVAAINDFQSMDLKYGMVVSVVEAIKNEEQPNQVRYVVQLSKKKHDENVFGVFADTYNAEKNEHIIYSQGDGHILVSDEGGNIEIGDYLCTSNSEGLAMKQDDDLLHNYTIAKATDNVDWSKEPAKTKLVSCSYHAQ